LDHTAKNRGNNNAQHTIIYYVYTYIIFSYSKSLN